MPINNLKAFIKILIKQSYHHEDEIKNIPFTCCHSTVRVIDFDRIKDSFFTALAIPKRLKSVDCIKVNTANNILYFIEMKSYTPGGTLTLNDWFVNRLECIPNKIIDSMFIILSFIGYYSSSKGLFKYFLNIDRLKTESIFLTDLNSIDLLSLTLAHQDKLGISLTKRITPPIVPMNTNDFIAKFP
jgi:hypothetical protein